MVKSTFIVAKIRFIPETAKLFIIYLDKYKP